MDLSRHYEELTEAVLHAFPSDGELQMMVQFDLGVDLDQVVSEGPLRQRVFDLIGWAEAEGRVDELLVSALERKPRNPKLKALAALVGPVPNEKRAEGIPPSGRALVEGLVDEEQESIVVPFVFPDRLRSTEGPLTPGGRFGPADRQGWGSAGFFAKDGQGNTYLVAPRFVLGGPAGTRIARPETDSGGDGEIIGEVVELLRPAPPEPTSLSFARIADPAGVTNVIPEVGAIAGLADRVTPGSRVVMVGAGSGKSEGRMLSVEPDGTIITTRISQAGDAGAPVLTPDRRLLGLLVGRDTRGQSTVVPVRQTLQDAGVELIQSRE